MTTAHPEESYERSFCEELEQEYFVPEHEPETEEKIDGDQLIHHIHDSIIGDQHVFDSPFGPRQITYADYTASSKSLRFIENYIQERLQSTCFRQEARQIIAQACNAKITGRGAEDCVLFTGSGSTGAVDKLVTALGLKTPWDPAKDASERAIVFVGPFEHHSNLLPWRESSAEVIMINEDKDGKLDLNQLETLLKKYASRPLKIGSFSAASNITGLLTNVDDVTYCLHKNGALSFWDYAACAPYVPIDMNPVTMDERRPFIYKDAIFISGHKFIGGPGTPGLLVAKKWVFNRAAPSQPGGGTVFYVTDQDHRYLSNREEREEGGTPDIIGSIRLGLAFQLKQRVGVSTIESLEKAHTARVKTALEKNPNIVLLGQEHESLPIFSFLVRCKDRFLHHNYVCALLNDLFGIQSRGGCQCAGPYGQRLLGLTREENLKIEAALIAKKELLRPGFSRLSFPYFVNDQDIEYILKAIDFVSVHGHAFLRLYKFNHKTGEWKHRSRFTKFPNRKWLSHFEFGKSYNTPKEQGRMSAKMIEQHRAEVLQEANDLISSGKLEFMCRQVPSQASDMMFSEEEQRLRWFLFAVDTSDGTKLCAEDEIEGVIKPQAYHEKLRTGAVHELEITQDQEPVVAATAVNACPCPSGACPPRRKPVEEGRTAGGKYPLRTGTEVSEGSAFAHSQQASESMAKKVAEAELFPTPPKKLMRSVGKAIIDFNMIEEGDRLMLGLSGGKDSLSLLHILVALQKRSPVKFEFACATVDPQTESFDPSPLKDYMKALNIPYFYLEEPIIENAKCQMSGDSLCSFCSRMKRGLLYTCCREQKYNKLVLAQHLDDLAESFIMSSMYNGQVRTMKACYWNEAKDIQVIRPLVYVREHLMKEFAYKARLPIINENCPACFEEPKQRQRVKKMLFQEESLCPNLYDSFRRALVPFMDDRIYNFMDEVRKDVESTRRDRNQEKAQKRPPVGAQASN